MISVEIILLLLLSIAAYVDIKTYEVPDLLSYSLFALGILFVAINSLVNSSFMILAYTLLSFSIAWIISMGLFLTGQWGGGDVKMLYAMSLFLGSNMVIFNVSVPSVFVFFFLTIFSGAVFGLFWMIYHVVYKWKDFKKVFFDLYYSKLSKKAKFYLIVLGLIVIASAPFVQIKILLALAGLYAYIILLYFLIIFTKAAEKSTSVKKVPISSLVEGDWIVDKEGIDASKKYNASSTGITSKEIKSLRSKGIKKVYIKNGVPFLPSFLIGYVIFLLI